VIDVDVDDVMFSGLAFFYMLVLFFHLSARRQA